MSAPSPARKRAPWTTAEDARLRELYPTTRCADLAARMGRTAGAIFQRARMLGLGKSAAFWASDQSGRLRPGRQHPTLAARHPAWTEAEDATLRARYPDEPTARLAQELGRSYTATAARAKKLGLQKSEAFQASELSGRVQRGKQHPRMIATQIQPGARPWNKGVKGSCGLHPNCRATQFKKGKMQGRAAEIAQPIGAERLSKEGYLQRKVNNDLPFQRRWKAVHRLVWEAAHGPVPAGHVVAFKPGTFSAVAEQIKAENLELVSFAENMRRNSYHNRYPKDVGRLIQLRGALNRKINRRARQEDSHEEQD